MFLSDVDIRKFIDKGIIKIVPNVKNEDFRQSGVRVHLSDIVYELNQSETPVDLRLISDNKILRQEFYKEIDLKALNDKSKPYILEPGKMVLGSTVEKIKMPNYMVGYLDGRSTVARFGITNNITASIIDNMDDKEPKNITIEINNCGNVRFVLYPNLPIGMLLFTILSSRTNILPSEQYADNQITPNVEYTHTKGIY